MSTKTLLLQSTTVTANREFRYRSPYTQAGIAAALLAGFCFLFIAFEVTNLTLISSGLFVIGGVFVWAALNAHRMRQLIHDTPQSRISSAAMGYVELQGKASFYGGRASQGFFHGPPCVWHRYRITDPEDKHNSDTGESDVPFLIGDGTGECVVNPVNALILSSSRKRWSKGGKIYSSQYIRHGARVYVIGGLVPNGCPVTSFNKSAEVGRLLSMWKEDKAFLIERFDQDGDNEIDMQEWEAARESATQLAKQNFQASTQEEAEKLIQISPDGRPLIISDKPPRAIALQLTALASACFLIALGAFFAVPLYVYGT